MNSAEEKAKALRLQIADAENELARLKLQLLTLEEKTDEPKESKEPETIGSTADGLVTHDDSKWPMNLDEYKRYGRQMIVPDIGIQG